MSPLLQRDRPAPQRSAPPVGVVPTVDLLPDVVRGRRAARALRMKCAAVLVVVVLLLVAALAWGINQRSEVQSRRTAAQAESDRLAAQIAGYAEVARLQTEIGVTRGAIMDGMQNEVLWADLVRHFEASLPSYAEIESLSISIVFDADFLSEGDGPFDPDEAIGQVAWVIDVPTLEQSGSLIAALDAADGFVGATFTTVDRDAESGRHQVSGTVHLDASVRSNRYVPEEPTADETAIETAQEATS